MISCFYSWLLTLSTWEMLIRSKMYLHGVVSWYQIHSIWIKLHFQIWPTFTGLALCDLWPLKSDLDLWCKSKAFRSLDANYFVVPWYQVWSIWVKYCQICSNFFSFRDLSPLTLTCDLDLLGQTESKFHENKVIWVDI